MATTCVGKVHFPCLSALHTSAWLMQRWARPSDTLTVTIRDCEGDGPQVGLTVITNGEPRSFAFDDVIAAVRFQSDMELFLLQTGWSFVQFSPEQRTYRDRRTFPRLTERRRWWTDARASPVTSPRRADDRRHR